MSRILTTPEPLQISAEIEVTMPFHDVDWVAVSRWRGDHL